MRVLKSICRKNKLFLFFSFLILGGRSARYLLVYLFFPLLSSCMFLWPLQTDRDYSLAINEKRFFRDVGRSYVINLFNLSQSRYLELKEAGGEYCLPGSMSLINEQFQVIRHEISGRLLGDASIRLHESFSALEKVRSMMEAMAEDGGCTLQYVEELIQKGQKPLRSDDSVLGLSDWPRPVNLKLFKRWP
ncbi:hypothetical protein [Endozoicomonas sp. SCSIO W0465]|uniref:hypothetical protein n=1 Tax=Endozoicomonas sp. SCSIO W0465 TaxID=2918516 RepID=UPI002074E9F8|nr:hypothetical protein [Endozoicomonas sp. SCSIO W0465]USE35165.1 hypothetical protein MJO57_24145 [Endozoicomonas sp. SCSIO W0465]